MKHTHPELYGLVLAGGKSTRMGSDKRLLQYHSVPQQSYIYQLLESVCKRTFLSIRDEQKSEMEENFEVMMDQNEFRGPFNGILSAHKAFPDAAWLVLACDLPLIDEKTLALLVSKRNPEKMATSMATNKTGLPEPLVTIWEPTGLKKAIAYLKTAESSCPRKYLLNSEIELVFPGNDEVLFNANSLEDYEHIKSKLEPTHGK
ncbi:NTP transferase domain-containing protein [Flagellimonas allohymeniacidonis]|uniref:Probable molybdenum cofactor guanylyltransferase n=1 Tax=Flagellimonas allohymeniacidonis TaxID=2517819 RepID=A0A4Q8QHM5_9FLAO|nr:NTP transferase domain-containing protein [Allomuricauda hymeniacidonis]TAI48788.1 molybdenum cofactor guanylyltransferase [Allomuricauda hymeniacidonis]